jgi:hypothetical protein
MWLGVYMAGPMRQVRRSSPNKLETLQMVFLCGMALSVEDSCQHQAHMPDMTHRMRHMYVL